MDVVQSKENSGCLKRWVNDHQIAAKWVQYTAVALAALAAGAIAFALLANPFTAPLTLGVVISSSCLGVGSGAMAFVLHKLRREAPRSEEQARVLLAAGGGESAALASGSSSSGALLSPRGVRPVSAPAPSPAALPSVCRFRDLTNEVFGAPSASSPVASMGSAPSAPDLSAPMAPFYSSSSQNSASGFVSSLGLPSLPFVPHAPVVSAANTGAPLSSVSTGPGHPDDDDLDDHDLLDPKPSPSGSAPSAASASSSSASAAAVPPFVEVRQAADENDEKERLWSLDQLPDLNFITRLVDERYAIGNHLSDSQAIVIQKNLIVGDLTELHHGLIQGEWSNFLKFSERALRELSPQDLSNYNNWFWFQLIPSFAPDPKDPTVATLAEAPYFARFRDIQPGLETLCGVNDGIGHGCFHANRVGGAFPLNRQFVATQAPIRETPSNKLFWLFVFQNNYKSILDVTTLRKELLEMDKEVESGEAFVTVPDDFSIETILSKYAEYQDNWVMRYAPEKDRPLVFKIDNQSDLVITFRSTQEINGGVVESYRITQGNVSKNIKRVHFQQWKDMEVTSVDDLATIIEHLKTDSIIHCRAGVGRTGTVILATVLEELLVNKHLSADLTVADVLRVLCALRQDRPYLVQKTVQLALVLQYIQERVLPRLI